MVRGGENTVLKLSSHQFLFRERGMGSVADEELQIFFFGVRINMDIHLPVLYRYSLSVAYSYV